MDTDLDVTVHSDAPYDLGDLTRDLAAEIDGKKEAEVQVEEKPKRGRPKKEDKAAKDKKEEVLPDVTETEQEQEQVKEQADDQVETEEEGDGTISIEDIPEDQRLEAATAIIDILSQEQKDQLLDKFGEGFSAELTKLRNDNKSLQQQVQEVEKKSRSRIDKIIAPNSFFADVATETELDDKEDKIRKNLNYYDSLIDSTDEVFEIGGKEYTRAEIRGFRNQYRKFAEDAKEHRYRIREVSKYRDRLSDSITKLSEKYDWYSDEQSEQRKRYDTLIGDIDLEHLKYVAPKSAAILPDIIARYVSTDEKEEGARRIFKLPIKQAKPKTIRIASGGGIVQQNKDVVSEVNRKAQTGELDMETFTKALAATL